MIKKYTKKPVTIQAIQFINAGNTEEILKWVGQYARSIYHQIENPDGSLITTKIIEIITLEGVMTARVGDYIIKGIQGEFYPCKPDIFEQTYKEQDNQKTCIYIVGYDTGDYTRHIGHYSTIELAKKSIQELSKDEKYEDFEFTIEKVMLDDKVMLV